MSIGQSPAATSKPTAPSAVPSHALPLGYGGFSFGQQAGVVSPMDTSSPGVPGASGRTNVGGGISRQMFGTLHHPSAYTTPITGNVQQGFYSHSPLQPLQPHQPHQQRPQTLQDDYFGGVQPSSAHSTSMAHASGAESTSAHGIGPILPSNTQSLGSAGIADAYSAGLSHVYYANSTSGPNELDIITSRVSSETNPQMFAAAWSEAPPASLTHQAQNGIYSSLPFDFGNFAADFLPFTLPPPVPPVLHDQQHTQGLTPLFPNSVSIVSQQGYDLAEHDLLSSTLGNVAMAIAKKDDDSDNLQKTLDHLVNVTTNISNASEQAFEHAKEVAAEAVAAADSTMQTEDWSFSDDIMNAPISESLLRSERRPGLSSKAVHNYFSYIHHQCPIIHKPMFLRQMGNGTVNRLVWFSLRALSTRTLLHSQILSKDDVLIEEAYFAAMARKQLATELENPNVEVLQGLVLFSLYILGTPRWEEASMYWCKAMRLAQLMGCHVVDAPSQTVATKMHFGIFEPPTARAVSCGKLETFPGDLSGLHLPLTSVLTPLETELRRRLWWVLFTNERFGAVAERLPTMVDESRIFVHLPCSIEEWEKPVFTYRAPERVPKYRREAFALGENTKDPRKRTLIQEIAARKNDNLYLISDIEYGFAMGHLVSFLAHMGSLFRPLSPYSNDYIQPFVEVSWQGKMRTLQANVDRIEALFEIARQDTLKRLNAHPNQGEKLASAGMPMHINSETLRAKKRRDSIGDGVSNSNSQPAAHSGQSEARVNNNNSGSSSSSTFQPAASRPHRGVDPILDEKASMSGIEIPHIHHLNMLILYSALNIQLYRMVLQIHYELTSSLPASDERKQEDNDLMAAFDVYIKRIWQRTTTAAQHVSRILRGEFPNVPHWVLTLVGINGAGSPMAFANGVVQNGNMEVDSETADKGAQQGSDTATTATTQSTTMSHRLKRIFRERIKAQEKRLHEMAMSVFASYRRTLPYALLLAAKVHVDNIKWWANEQQDEQMAHAYLDLAVIVQFLETHQTAFSSTDYVALVKSMMQVVDIS
ncbi:hypothetical protein LPJ72_001683 [Coemansia sp. Benny D160-2]|nr:hypothetical protein LPJ72_001683 [Coemansia sp. Benny D160-2]